MTMKSVKAWAILLQSGKLLDVDGNIEVHRNEANAIRARDYWVGKFPHKVVPIIIKADVVREDGE